MEHIPRSALVHKQTKRWFQKHQGLLLILGTLIIVTTFIVKNVFREQLKDVVDSINAAENLYLIRDSNLELHEEIDQVDANVSRSRIEILQALPSAKKNQTQKDAWAADFDRNSQRLLRVINETYLETDNLARLVMKAPPTPEHMAQFTELYKQWGTLRIDLLKGDQAELNLEDFDSKAAYNRNLKGYAAVWILNQKLHLVGSMILDDAHEVKERKERLVRVFTPISYGLFILGAVLTFLSKLFGVETGGDES
jgi:hypothetical protein